MEQLVRGVPFFTELGRVDIARIVGALQPVDAPAGAAIVTEGDEADGMYLLEDGEVEVSLRTESGDVSVARLRGPAHFGEIGLLLHARAMSVRAVSPVRLWKFPRERFERLAAERPTFALAVATSAVRLLHTREREHLHGGAFEEPAAPVLTSRPAAAHTGTARALRIAASVGIPLGLALAGPPAGLSEAGWHVVLVLLGAALLWLLDPLPDVVVALLLAAGWGVVAGISPGTVLAGFASPSWLVALGSFVLAAAMIRSGLIFRAALRLLRLFPATHAGQVAALLASGIILTPLVPLALARVAAVTPLAQELASALGHGARSRGSAALAFAVVIGHGALSSVFLSGLVMNFFVADLLPPSDRVRFGSLGWAAAAAPYGLLVLVGGVILLFTAFRPRATPRLSVELVRRQEVVLAALSRAEWLTIAATAVLIVGLLVQPWVRIDTAWLAVATSVIVLGGGVIDRQAFRSAIDWGFLVLFGVLLGSGGVLERVAADRWIAAQLLPLAQAVASPGLVLLALAAMVMASRLLVPWIPATLLWAAALVPVATQLGLSPWSVGFVVLVAANTWIVPGQSDFCRMMRELSDGELFTGRQALIAGTGLTAATTIALALSLPFWSWIGVLEYSTAPKW